jgi:hypothetical protein
MAEKTTAFTGPVVVGLNDKKGEIRLTDGKNVNEAKYLSIAAPDTITSDTTLTFPNGAGTAGQILSTDGSGNLSWVNDSAGNPDGTSGQVQFNDNGTFGAIPDGTSGQVLKSNGAGVAPSFQEDTSGIAAVVDDTTPELGGDLASNGHDINFADNDKAKFGDSGDLEIYHDGSNSIINDSGTGQLKISGFDAVKITNSDDTIPMAQFISSGEAQLYYAGNQKLATNTNGIQTTGNVNVNGAYTLPTSDGTANQILTTDGGGNVTFQTAAAAGATDINGLSDAIYDSNQNLGLGDGAVDAITTGSDNIGIGENALTSVTDGNRNVAIGASALEDATGWNNVVVGSRAGQDLTTGDGSVFLGFYAGKGHTTEKENIAIGAYAMFGATGGERAIAIGRSALSNNQADHTIGIGYQAGVQNTTGTFNTYLGFESGLVNTTGSENCLVGMRTGHDLATGGKNALFGARAGENVLGSNNTLIGWSSGSTLTTGSNVTTLGYDAEPSSATATNEITLGNSSITSLRIPGLQSGATSGDVLTFNGTDITLAAGGGGGGGTSWQSVITTNTTAAAGQGFFVNTSGGAVTLTLPASPTQGDEVSFVDYAGTAATDNITIGRNGENIQGSASDLIINTNRASNTLVYSDATQGWLLTNI